MDRTPMQMLPENLTDTDRVLLHLADELSGAEREAFVARLDHEPPLRTLVARLAAEQDAVYGALDVADRGRPLPSGRGAAFALAAAAQEHRQAVIPRRRVRPWWLHTWTLYPIGAAAAVAIGFYVWWASIGTDEVVHPYGNLPGDRPVLALRSDPNADPASLREHLVVAQ